MYGRHGGLAAKAPDRVLRMCCLLEAMVRGGDDHIGSATVSISTEGRSSLVTCSQVSAPEDLLSSGGSPDDRRLDVGRELPGGTRICVVASVPAESLTSSVKIPNLSRSSTKRSRISLRISWAIFLQGLR